MKVISTPDYPFYIVGFFWSSINEQWDKNMIFIDSLDWENRLGPDVGASFIFMKGLLHMSSST